MVDTNVNFQDTVRLVEKLIELRKQNWEVAPYPVEDHGFEREESWADEYKRILKLFVDNLKPEMRTNSQTVDPHPPTINNPALPMAATLDADGALYPYNAAVRTSRMDNAVFNE